MTTICIDLLYYRERPPHINDYLTNTCYYYAYCVHVYVLIVKTTTKTNKKNNIPTATISQSEDEETEGEIIEGDIPFDTSLDEGKLLYF